VDRQELLQRLRAVLLGDRRIAVAWLFGSAARDQMRADSDVDVAVLLARDLPGAARNTVLADIASRLESTTAPHPVDVVDLEAQGHVFVHRALQDGHRIVVHDEERRVDFESDALVRYLDFKPTWDLAANEQVGGMRRWLQAYRRR